MRAIDEGQGRKGLRPEAKGPMRSTLESEPPARSSPSSVLAARMSPASQRILSGPLALEIARFGVPLAVGMGLQTSFNLVDAYIISGLGGTKASAALGAIGVADLIGAVGTILSYGLSIASSAIISRKQGEGDMEGVRRVAWQSVLLLVGVSAIVSSIGIFGAEGLMVGLAGAKGEVARVGTQFLRVMMGGSFTIFLLLDWASFIRPLQDLQSAHRRSAQGAGDGKTGRAQTWSISCA